jgi:disulfide bond formation protein DsbB
MNRLLHYLQTPRYLAAAIAIASAVILSGAYISQYGFGLKPCILCLYQRVPYLMNIALGVVAFLISFRYPRLTKPLLALAVLSFCVGAAIAGFHVGVEQGWWKGLPSCGGDIVPKNVSIDELREAMEHQAIVRCDQPAFVFLGISMAGYNFLISLALVGGIVYLLRKKTHGA